MKVKRHNRDIAFNPYYTTKDVITILDFQDGKEGYKKFYHGQNSLKFCNGSYLEFVEKSDKLKYLEFYKKYHNITNFYNGAIID